MVDSYDSYGALAQPQRGGNRDRGLTAMSTVVNPYLPDFTAHCALVTWMDACVCTWDNHPPGQSG